MEKQYVFFDTGTGCLASLAGFVVAAVVLGLALYQPEPLELESRSNILYFLLLSLIIAISQIPAFLLDVRKRKSRKNG